MTNRLKTYFIKTFGCQMNESDSEKISAWYNSRGWKPAKSAKVADEIVINTCSVRESAEHRAMGLVNNLAKRFHLDKGGTLTNHKPRALRHRLILTGCMLYHGISTLKKKLPNVNEFKPIDEFKTFPPSIIPARIATPARNAVSTAGWQSVAGGHHPSSGPVPIMEGCNNFCSYCVVPYARGRERSRPFEEIVCEVTKLARKGVKEITLLGQNVNSYQPSFAKLLHALNKIPGIKKISFMTSNPWDLTGDIIEAMKLPKIDRYLHLPVQSGDDEILRHMNRHYMVQDYLDLVKKVRRAIPEIKIGTDIIVGFPGETKEQFQHTVDLCTKVGFVKAYIGRYSPRPQTLAYKLKDDVPPAEKKRRWQILEKLINQKK